LKINEHICENTVTKLQTQANKNNALSTDVVRVLKRLHSRNFNDNYSKSTHN